MVDEEGTIVRVTWLTGSCESLAVEVITTTLGLFWLPPVDDGVTKLVMIATDGDAVDGLVNTERELEDAVNVVGVMEVVRRWLVDPIDLDDDGMKEDRSEELLGVKKPVQRVNRPRSRLLPILR